MSEKKPIRFVVLQGGRGDYPLRAETFSEPPSAGTGPFGDSWGWPGKGVRWKPERGKLRDFDGWNGSGPVKVREIPEAHAAVIASIEAEIASVKARLAALQNERTTACEIASSRGKPVSVAAPKASE